MGLRWSSRGWTGMQFSKSFLNMTFLAHTIDALWIWLRRPAGAAMRAFIGLLTIMLTSLTFAPAAHADLSSACTAINDDLNSPHYITTAAGNFNEEYQNLNDGEYISWTMSTTGAGLSASAAVSIFTSSNYDLYFDRSNLISRGGNKNESGDFTASASANLVQIILDVSQESTPPSDSADLNTLTFSASCAATAPAPTVTSISPTSGPVAGGTSVTITGTGFTGATAVTIGGQPATGITVTSATKITAITPAGTVGATNVVVTTSYGSSALTNGYTYVAPTIAFSPAAGALTGATVGTAYSQTVTASGGTAPYTYAITSGSLPAGLSLDTTTGAITGTPTTAGNASFTITATDANSFTGSASYSLAVTVAAPVANAVSATVATNSSSNAITLNITGGAATSVAIGSPASHGTATASGTAITYTPTAGYSGSDNFTYTATNASGTSASATVTITVSAPTFVMSPAAGALTGATAGTAYSQTITASGGTAPYTYAITSGSLPAGLSLDTTTGAITGTPTTAGNASFTITATDANSVTGSASYSLAVTVAAPVANAVSATVAANSSSNPISLNITGGTATSVAIGTAASHGTATASGTAITYTPTAGYSGSDNFSYTATNASGTSAPATVTITVTAPTFTMSPAAGALTAATVGTAYSQTVAASGGTAPYTYAVTGTLPAGLSLNTTTGAITGTPTTAGNASFTITATDANSVTGAANYSLAVAAQSVALALSPSSGALTAATVGNAYNQSVTATNGTGPYTYSGTGLPNGLSINTSTGAITGTPTTAGSYTITVAATDSTSPANSGSSSYTLVVNAAATIVFSPSGGALKDAMAGEAYSQQISVTGGSGTLIYSLASGTLPKGMVLNISTGALNGPLDTGTEGNYTFSIQASNSNGATGSASYTIKVAARAVTVADHVVEVPAGATPNNVYLNKEATGGPFFEADIVAVEPPEAGTATLIQGELAAVATGSLPVGWYLKFTPNPAYSGQVRVSYRLGSSLGSSNTGAVIYKINYNAEQVAADIDNLVHSFVKSRQSMISSTIKVPGLMERAGMARATTPVTTRVSPSATGMTLGFSTSLAQMESARDSADGIAGGYSSPFNIWIDGALLAHNDKETNGSKWGSFAMINLGADYLINDRALLGFSFHYDRMTDPSDQDAMLTGNGWLAGPYTSFEIAKGVFWDASLLYGGSSNTIDMPLWDGNFDTLRWMMDTSVKGKWSLDEVTVVTPKLRAVYFSETVDDYTVKNSAGDMIDLDGFTSEQFRVSLGAEIARSFTLASGSTMTPKLGITTGFAGLNGSGMFGSITAGASLETTEAWAIEANLLFNIEGEGEKSVGARAGLSRRF
jgi:large repetitive protein